ncbi:MAG TPA: hypothetical protein VFW85_10810, partial [Gaiellaceae bacterium]|nr:hypothetical protein [Gaiellaceae bacterium]
ELPVGTELHGAHLFGGMGDFEGKTVADRVDIFRLGLKALERHDCRIAVSAHVPGSTDVPPLDDWRMGVLRQLVPQVEQIARDAGEYVILVCDEEQSTAREVVEMLHDGKDAVGIYGTPIIETAMFARSVYSPGVWPADLVAFTERRIELDYDHQDPRARHTLRRFRGLYASCLLEPVILTGAPVPEKAV